MSFMGVGRLPNFPVENLLLLVWLGLVRAAGRFEATYDELNGTHNGLKMQMHFEGDKRLVGVSISMFFCPGTRPIRA